MTSRLVVLRNAPPQVKKLEIAIVQMGDYDEDEKRIVGLLKL